MPDSNTISLGKDLLDMAIEFQDVSNRLQSIAGSMSGSVQTMSSPDFYEGKNRENIALANQASLGHIVNLQDFYGMCFAYIVYTYNSMVELDEALALEIQKAYIGEHYG